MGHIVLISLLIIFSLIFATVAKFYDSVPEKELKRRARSGNSTSTIYYMIVKNRQVAEFYLKLIMLILVVWAFVLISSSFNQFWAVVVIMVVSIVYFFVLASEILAGRLAKIISPIFLNLIVKTKKYTLRIAKLADVYLASKPRSKVYELEDLVELIMAQKNAKTNRIDTAKLDLALSTLTFGDKTVIELMMPKKNVRFVDGDETIGTILIDELHQTGHRYFPVYKNDKHNIVGTLDLNDLVEKRLSGKVAWAINSEVIELNQEDSLQDVLDLFLKTKQQFYVVVGPGQKLVGVLNIEQVLKAMIGKN